MTSVFRWIGKIWREIHDETSPDAAPRELDWRPLGVLIVAVVSLTCQYYFGDRPFFRDLAAAHGWKLPHIGFYADLWYTGARVVGCLILPTAIVLAIPGQRLADHGWSPRGLGSPVVIVLLLAAAAAPLVGHPPHDRAIWIAQAFVQIVALEFLFRGFLLRNLERVAGMHAIWAAAVPYVMIHYNDGPAEGFASIDAAVMLGALALRTGSIWRGVAVSFAASVAVHVLDLHVPRQLVIAIAAGGWWVIDLARERVLRLRPDFDWRPIVILLVTALSLTIQEFVGDRGLFLKYADDHNLPLGRWDELASFAWWSGWRVIGYLILPMVVVLFMPGERLRDYGWSPRGFFRHIHYYLGLYLLVLPLVYFASRTPAFRHMYPFYRLSNRSTFDFVAWEVMYALQFLSLEFFFRGFMLHGLKRTFGSHAIWVMVVPYCMIHYGKTFAETIGAIIAGITLGTIALRTKSIWGGVVIHVGVALTMDLLTLRALP